jgi:hypothetical protein
MNKSNSFFNVVLVLGLIILIGVIYNYNNKKKTRDNMYSGDGGRPQMDISNNHTAPVLMNTTDNNYLNVAGLSTNPGPLNQQLTNPSDLLPKDMNSEWSNVNPANADLKSINLLSAGQLIGINTVGSSLRNPSLQERSEPPIPKENISPWNQSTIDPDTLRRTLEIG